LKAFHLRIATPVRPDWDARRAFYGGDLARRSLEAMRATSRLVVEGDVRAFGAVLTFFASEDDAALAEERVAPFHAELDPAMRTFGEFRRVADVRGTVLGAIRVNAPRESMRVLVAVGASDPPPPVPGQDTVFLARLRGADGSEALVHVASDDPRDAWPSASFIGRGVVVHVDRGDAMP
jgi:hypothetical protein